MLCNSCGKEVQPGHDYCGCERGVGKMPSRLARHRRPVGILWIVYAVSFLPFGIWMFNGTVILPRGQLSHWEDGVEVPSTPVENAVPALVTALVLVWGIVSLIAGWGLLMGSILGRKLAVMVGILSLSSVVFGGVTAVFTPLFSFFTIFFGTALGIYTLWVLTSRDAKREYDALARDRAFSITSRQGKT